MHMKVHVGTCMHMQEIYRLLFYSKAAAIIFCACLIHWQLISDFVLMLSLLNSSRTILVYELY